MSRRSILSANERNNLLSLPDSNEELIRQYSFDETDLAIIKQHRGATNRLGFAVHLCCMRYPGILLELNGAPNSALLHLVASQLKVAATYWHEYGLRAETRREHLLELRAIFEIPNVHNPRLSPERLWSR